ncbi:MAG TPA: type I methionyl aminopeptidase [Dehalococcoidia bacterium]|nr:type I methionyl aminopeptidase [Dehalococcoidia bacterium]
MMREGGGMLAEMLSALASEVRPGIRTRELDEMVEEWMAQKGVVASFKGYNGFPASVCVSVNEEVVHGIPGERLLRQGDIVSLDLGVHHRGFHTDAAITVPVGEVSEEARQLIETTRESLLEGIRQARPGNHVGDIGAAIQRYVEERGFSVIREYTGHGVGRQLHEDPQVPNFMCGRGAMLRPGMTLAIEPMVAAGDWRTRVGADKWVVLTADGSPAAHFEHTIAVTDGEPEVFA